MRNFEIRYINNIWELINIYPHTIMRPKQIIISADKVYTDRECIHTQLCMAFATIIDQVGILESNRLKGGMTLGFAKSFSTFKDFGLMLRIYSSSYRDIWKFWSGVLVVAEIHIITHKKPHNPNIINGPNTPACDMRIGESVSPIALPSWNPPIARPTAWDRSVEGNHLTSKGQI